jgi:TRAP-type mannitol/chloroaromatic compound transport system substrate-binding protein
VAAASSFPKASTPFRRRRSFKRCASATNKFQIQVFAAGDRPGIRRSRRCPERDIQRAHTAPYYFFGKDPTFGSAARFRSA